MMPEAQGVVSIIEILSNLGIPGALLFVWYVNDKRYQQVLSQYQQHFDELRKMYKEATKLNESYSDLARSLKDVVVLNTTVISELRDDIRTNQFCPMNRIPEEKRKL